MALRKPAVNTESTPVDTAEVKTAVDPVNTSAAEVATDTKAVEEKPDTSAADEALKLKQEATARAAQDEKAAAAQEALAKEEVKQEAPAKEDKHADVVPEEKAVAVAAPEADKAVTVSEARGGMFQAFKEELAAEGFEDMEVTGMSFERVRLHEGTFKIGGDDAELGKEFKCQILSSRAIYVVRQSSEQDAEMFYSYDPAGKLKTDGTSAEETLAEWRADGYGVEGSPLEIKPYREVMATLKGRDDEYDEMVVSLSIPPASVDRIAGVAFTAKQKFKALPSGVITECKVGKLVGEGTKAFRPWIFKVTQTVEQFDAAQAAADA